MKGRWVVPAVLLALTIAIVLLNPISIRVPDFFSSETSGEVVNVDQYPSTTIEVVVPSGAGGDTDLAARVTSKYLSEELGTNMVVSNIAGAGGTLGARDVLEGDPDGHKVLFFHNTLIINELFQLSNFGFEDYKIAAIALMDYGDSFIIHADSRFDSVDDFIKEAKERPGEVSVGTEVGAYTHLQLLAFEEATDTSYQIVDVGSASDKIIALMGNQVDMIPIVHGVINDYVESGHFRNMGTLSNEDPDTFEGQPSLVDSGIDLGFEKFFYFAFPPDTPDEIVDQFAVSVEAVVQNDTYQEEIGQYFVTPTYMDRETATSYMKETKEHYQTIVDKLEDQAN